MNTIDPEDFVVVNASNKKWYGELVPAFCSHCNQSFFMKKEFLNHYCPFCLENGFEIHPILTFSNKPELLVPFRINNEQVDGIYKQFLENSWFKPDDLSASSLKSRTTFHYWVMWLLDSQVDGYWKAEMGFDYKVKSSVETFENHTWDSKDEIEIKTRWENRMGEVHRLYENINLPALAQHGKFIRMIGDFNLKYVTKISEADLNEMIVCPDLDPQNFWDQAKLLLDKAVENNCAHASDAQHIRGFSISAEYSQQNWTLLLLPYIASYYVHDTGEKIPVYINGQTGNISGARLTSTRKVQTYAAIGGIFAIIMLISGILALTLGILIPPLPILGMMLIAISLITGIMAILPVIWTMFHNKQENETAIHL